MSPENPLGTDPKRLPPELLERVLAWKPGPRGLILRGPTRACKTRCMFLLMEKLHREGMRLAVFHGVERGFAHHYVIESGLFHGEQWLAQVAKKDAVLFDDLGKWKLTDGNEAALSLLIEELVSSLKPVFITTNSGGKGLKDRMTLDRGDPLVERLREFCDMIDCRK